MSKTFLEGFNLREFDTRMEALARQQGYSWDKVKVEVRVLGEALDALDGSQDGFISENLPTVLGSLGGSMFQPQVSYLGVMTSLHSDLPQKLKEAIAGDLQLRLHPAHPENIFLEPAEHVSADYSVRVGTVAIYKDPLTGSLIPSVPEIESINQGDSASRAFVAPPVDPRLVFKPLTGARPAPPLPASGLGVVGELSLIGSGVLLGSLVYEGLDRELHRTLPPEIIEYLPLRVDMAPPSEESIHGEEDELTRRIREKIKPLTDNDFEIDEDDILERIWRHFTTIYGMALERGDQSWKARVTDEDIDRTIEAWIRDYVISLQVQIRRMEELGLHTSHLESELRVLKAVCLSMNPTTHGFESPQASKSASGALGATNAGGSDNGVKGNLIIPQDDRRIKEEEAELILKYSSQPVSVEVEGQAYLVVEKIDGDFIGFHQDAVGNIQGIRFSVTTTIRFIEESEKEEWELWELGAESEEVISIHEVSSPPQPARARQALEAHLKKYSATQALDFLSRFGPANCRVVDSREEGLDWLREAASVELPFEMALKNLPNDGEELWIVQLGVNTLFEERIGKGELPLALYRPRSILNAGYAPMLSYSERSDLFKVIDNNDSFQEPETATTFVLLGSDSQTTLTSVRDDEGDIERYGSHEGISPLSPFFAGNLSWHDQGLNQIDPSIPTAATRLPLVEGFEAGLSFPSRDFEDLYEKIAAEKDPEEREQLLDIFHALHLGFQMRPSGERHECQ